MTLMPQQRNTMLSIRSRLLVSAGIWLFIVMVMSGLALTLLFRNHELREFREGLEVELIELESLVDATENGEIFIIGHPASPRTNKPLSGWYWQITADDVLVEKSRSLWTYQLPFPTSPPVGKGTYSAALGPQGQDIRMLARAMSVPGSNKLAILQVAGPETQLNANVLSYSYVIAGVLSTLGIGLFVAILIQINFGLRPFKRLKERLAAVAQGRAETLPENLPAEVRPLAIELNTLLLRNAEMLERARTQVGNLAHALKTPLSIVRGEVSRLPPPTAEAILPQLSEVDRHVATYLARARVAGMRGVLGARVSVQDVVTAVCRAIAAAPSEKVIETHTEGLANLWFGGDQNDLEEILGNLIENAHKWARHCVMITGRHSDLSIIVVIDDDGPGISPDQRQNVLNRGQRLDTSKPGSGIGLSIVRDIVSAYEGILDLGPSDNGGLRVQVVLPAAVSDG